MILTVLDLEGSPMRHEHYDDERFTEDVQTFLDNTASPAYPAAAGLPHRAPHGPRAGRAVPGLLQVDRRERRHARRRHRLRPLGLADPRHGRREPVVSVRVLLNGAHAVSGLAWTGRKGGTK